MIWPGILLRSGFVETAGRSPKASYSRQTFDRIDFFLAFQKLKHMIKHVFQYGGVLMHLDRLIRDSVMFLGVAERTVFRAKATAFQVSYPTSRGPVHYLVTTERTIQDLLDKGHSEIMFRGNSPAAVDFSIPIAHWFFHPEANSRASDVAVAQLSKNIVDQKAIPTECFISGDEPPRPEFGVGATIATVGLFRNHYGRGKNISVARVGNIAALPEEPIRTDRGEMDTILVELQSTGGLAGSPVFIEVTKAHEMITRRAGSNVALLGLLSGQFTLHNPIEDAVVDKSLLDGERTVEAIHSGIGVVIPAQKILETLNRPEFSSARTEALSKMQDHAGDEGNLSSVLPMRVNSDLAERIIERSVTQTSVA